MDVNEKDFSINFEKQPPEVFSKKAVFKSFAIFTAKKPVLESLFDKVTGL